MCPWTEERAENVGCFASNREDDDDVACQMKIPKHLGQGTELAILLPSLDDGVWMILVWTLIPAVPSTKNFLSSARGERVLVPSRALVLYAALDLQQETIYFT